MKKFAFASALLVLCAYSADAYGVYLYNRSGGKLCAAETRDEADPFDENVARITKGWLCVEDFGTLHFERSDGFLDIAIKRADGTDYVADDSTQELAKILVYVPKDEATEKFGVEILKHAAGWAAISWFVGPEEQWSSYQTVRNHEDLPAKLNELGFKQVVAWHIDAQHNGFGYILKKEEVLPTPVYH